MKILFAPDSFKGTMSAQHITELLCVATREHFPDSELVCVPVGDGGEGTTESLIQVMNGRYVPCSVSGPLGDMVDARYGVLEGMAAIIEMAQASGLPLIPAGELNPRKATSYGTGELLCHAIEAGCRDIYLTIGGSATNDGGLGAAAALGLRFLDENGVPVELDGAGLNRVASIDASLFIKKMEGVRLTIMSDVTNPLLGKNGATFVYGRQKGATEEMQRELEAGMENYVGVLETACGKRLRDIPGSGAAGGIALPFLAFADAKIQSGIDTVLELVQFDRLLEGVDLVVTGEGCLDYQSAYGKVLDGIGRACRKKGIPAVAIAGCMGEGAPLIYERGISSAISCVNQVMSREESFARADELFLQAVDQMYRFIKVGMRIQNP